MNEVNEAFIRLYEPLRLEVNRRAGEVSSHAFKIEKAAERNVLVRRNADLLKYIRDIRHVLMHPRHRSDGAAAVVSQAFLAETEALLDRLRTRPVASVLGVPRGEIRTAQLADRLGDLADEMKRGGFSHVPIVDAGDAVIGVFNAGAVFDHLWAESETIVGREMAVADIFAHCRLEARHAETFRFVRPQTQLDDLREMFTALDSSSGRLGAVFVTVSGKASGPLQRMITPWDVLARAGR